ncbi:hypothetical protein Sste5346_004623 [Sporothrix stenoceras]|uniref:Uncharacterized protein n=1 Tax=Sporothrix stenoceras TaxID=5173 RepID=A0ABR3Z7J3_9PEZI
MPSFMSSAISTITFSSVGSTSEDGYNFVNSREFRNRLNSNSEYDNTAFARIYDYYTRVRDYEVHMQGIRDLNTKIKAGPPRDLSRAERCQYTVDLHNQKAEEVDLHRYYRRARQGKKVQEIPAAARDVRIDVFSTQSYGPEVWGDEPRPVWSKGSLDMKDFRNDQKTQCIDIYGRYFDSMEGIVPEAMAPVVEPEVFFTNESELVDADPSADPHDSHASTDAPTAEAIHREHQQAIAEQEREEICEAIDSLLEDRYGEPYAGVQELEGRRNWLRNEDWEELPLWF